MRTNNNYLEWGETPWDDWSREDLRREVQRMYWALKGAHAVMEACRQVNPDLPYWRPGHGRGGIIRERVERALAPYVAKSEQMYRAFFRYAGDLLLGTNEDGWATCNRGHLTAADGAPLPEFCLVCGTDDGAQIPARPIAWSDLEKKT